MPLMKPEIQEVLRAAGLAKDQPKTDAPLTEKLNAAGLGLSETLDEIASIVKGSGNEALRFRALETVLKAHGALKESIPPPPSFTIVIQDTLPNPSQTPSVNPILLPRQLLKQLNSTSTLS